MKKRVFNTIIILITIISMVLGLTACENKDATSENNKNDKDNISESLSDALNNKSNAEKNNEIESVDVSVASETKRDELITPTPTILNLQKDLRSIAEKRIPAVVNIRSEVEYKGGNNLFDFYDYFGRPDRNNNDDDEDEPRNTQQALGSGFIISNDGYVVTNNHVVEDAVKVTIILSDEREFDAEIIGTDSKTDVALLKINTDQDLPVLPLGNSNTIAVGDIAVAIGNPFGLSGSFTMGVISATGRDQGIDIDASFKDYIQTDAPINQGNSGGPLLNIYGEVIGMNTAIYSTTGGSIGIGFAVPINIVKRIVEDLADDGKIERPMLGITVTSLDEDIAETFGIAKNEGALVNEVVPDSPADIAGIQPSDIITKIDDKNITSSNDVVKTVVSYQVGEVIELSVLRLKNQTDIEELSIPVTLGLRDDKKFEELRGTTPKTDQGDGDTKEWKGLSLGNYEEYKSTSELKDISGGLIVLEVDTDSDAFEKGIRKGDVIISINGVNVDNISELGDIKDAKSYLLRVYTKAGSRIIVIK